MRMKQLKARAKKYLRMRKSSRTRKNSRMRNTIGGFAIVLVLVIWVGAAMFALPVHENSMPQAVRMAENRKAQLELQSAADSATPDYRADAAAQRKPASTVTGCLQRREDGFRLKNAGGDVPHSRSWKSGFLKKGTPPIDVVDASNRLKLKDHVGQQISVTGVLVDREMRARSLQRVAVACN